MASGVGFSPPDSPQQGSASDDEEGESRGRYAENLSKLQAAIIQNMSDSSNHHHPGHKHRSHKLEAPPKKDVYTYTWTCCDCGDQYGDFLSAGMSTDTVQCPNPLSNGYPCGHTRCVTCPIEVHQKLKSSPNKRANQALTLNMPSTQLPDMPTSRGPRKTGRSRSNKDPSVCIGYQGQSETPSDRQSDERRDMVPDAPISVGEDSDRSSTESYDHDLSTTGIIRTSDGGSEDINVILDTGASSNFISRATATRLGLKVYPIPPSDRRANQASNGATIVPTTFARADIHGPSTGGEVFNRAKFTVLEDIIPEENLVLGRNYIRSTDAMPLETTKPLDLIFDPIFNEEQSLTKGSFLTSSF